jgi:hypothetical protein
MTLERRSIPFVIKAPLEEEIRHATDKKEAFERLEELRKSIAKTSDFED